MKLFAKLLTALGVLAALLVMSVGSAQASTTGTDNSASSVSTQISATGSSKAAPAKLTQKQYSQLQAVSPQTVICSSPSFGPDYFHIICNGDQWWTPWVNCSDGLWYAVNSFLGAWEVYTFCPPGLTAVAGAVTF
jgi:hypothetical protein